MNAVNFFDLRKTIADRLLLSAEYPREAVDMISEYIRRVGKKLDRSKYLEIKRDIWIAKNAEVSESAKLCAPLIVGERSEISGCASLSGGVIIGKDAFVGAGSEIKRSILFDGARATRNNYISYSIVGHLAHFGAGAIVSSQKSDLGSINSIPGSLTKKSEQGRLGAVIGDGADIGYSSVLSAGAVVEAGAVIPPLTRLKGFISAEDIHIGERILLSDIL